MSVVSTVLTFLEQLVQAEPKIAAATTTALLAFGGALPAPVDAFGLALVGILNAFAATEPELSAVLSAWAQGTDHPSRPAVDAILGAADKALADA